VSTKAAMAHLDCGEGSSDNTHRVSAHKWAHLGLGGGEDAVGQQLRVTQPECDEGGAHVCASGQGLPASSWGEVFCEVGGVKQLQEGKGSVEWEGVGKGGKRGRGYGREVSREGATCRRSRGGSVTWYGAKRERGEKREAGTPQSMDECQNKAAAAVEGGGGGVRA